MQAIIPRIKPQVCKDLFFSIILVSFIGNCCDLGKNRVWATNLENQENPDEPVSNVTYFSNIEENQQSDDDQVKYSEIQVETLKQDFSNLQQLEESRYLPTKTPKPIEKRYNESDINSSQQLEPLIQDLQKQAQVPPESDINQELGLRVRPKPLEGIPPVESKPIGSLKARVGYFQASNIFSAQDNPIEDGLVFSGLTLASTYFPLSSSTYINGSIDGNLIRYLDQSKYSYNQVRLNLGIYQQLSQKMYGELSWNNQQLFYAQNDNFFQSGERFLNEHSLRLSLGRRDTLSQKLMLDSIYELSVNFSDPESRSRVINSFWVSLNYYLQKPLQVGINYKLNLSDFTQREREDQLHRLYANLNYSISKTSNVNLQSGMNFGDSSQSNIDFSSWFFSVNYNFELGKF
ncbi:hypothetical protein [Anabaena sp. UHCC 0204]|uniref:hypothetical protein n=1 Tax=Anabaena sp. UHCC 0204 TaxID=2590009 RepID=UPI001C2BBE1F|nr:hypothetical protein [Anabaena sp. UHCC 0204]